MAYDRFMIAPINSGLQTDLKPFLIPDDAFAQLNNAYVFRGRLRKRFGSILMGTGACPEREQLHSRLRIYLDVTNGAGILAGNVPGTIWKIGQGFSIALPGVLDVVFTVVVANGQMLRTDGSAEVATYNTGTGAFSITVAALPAAPVYFYPSEPVMGISQYEVGPINNQPTYAFDTQFCYLYAGGFWNWIGPTAGSRFHGSNSKFFWTTTWTGITHDLASFFVTNFNATVPGIGANDDPMWTYDGANWAVFSPKFLLAGVGNYVQTARMILPFKDRLILLNTVERNEAGTVNAAYVNRCRYSRNGSPFTTAPIDLGPTDGFGALAGVVPGATGKVGQQFVIGAVNFTVTNPAPGVQIMTRIPAGGTLHTFDIATGAFNFTGEAINTHVYYYPDQSAWLEPNQPGSQGAGYIDAPTEEAIISAEFIKDRLIVYFDRSTWELAYTGNQVLPFVWQKINTELGSQSTFSTVPFDRLVFTIGNTGIHACSGTGVERIDSKIPDQIFEMSLKNNGVERVAGIRDYFTEMVYWTFPAVGGNIHQVYPNKVLVYNYKNGSWAFNDDAITAFGYFEQQTGTTWASAKTTWARANFPWTSGVTALQVRQIIAGNQQGYMFIISPDTSSNAAVLQLSEVITVAGNTNLFIIDHNLAVDDFIKIIDSPTMAFTDDPYNLPGGAGIGITDGAGGAAGILLPPRFEQDVLGDRFIIGTEIFTVDVLGNPGAMVSTGGGAGTFDTTTGAYTFVGCTPATQIIYYPYTDNIFKVEDIIANYIDLGHIAYAGVYRGGATIARVSNIEIETKQINPYRDQGKNVYLAKVDFYVKKTDGGEVTVDYYPSSTTESMITEAEDSNAALGTNILETSAYENVSLEEFQDQLWHPVYFQTDGDNIQLFIYMDDVQMMNAEISEADFELDAMVLYTMAISRLQ